MGQNIIAPDFSIDKTNLNLTSCKLNIK